MPIDIGQKIKIVKEMVLSSSVPNVMNRTQN